MCKYCESETDNEIYKFKDGREAYYFYISDYYLCVELHFEYGNSFVKCIEINNCPMCGREL